MTLFARARPSARRRERDELRAVALQPRLLHGVDNARLGRRSCVCRCRHGHKELSHRGSMSTNDGKRFPALSLLRAIAMPREKDAQAEPCSEPNDSLATERGLHNRWRSVRHFVPNGAASAMNCLEKPGNARSGKFFRCSAFCPERSNSC